MHYISVKEAAVFAKRTGAKYAVPFHVGMFDHKDSSAFATSNKIVPKIYSEIIF